MGDAENPIGEGTSDSELLSLLRSGSSEAYAELWCRHIQAALRVAGRIAPGQAEDLVSESFLAVYRQVTTTDSGPRSAFRAYLYTVMRNTAMRWRRAEQLVDTDPEIEEVDLHDGLRFIEERAEAAEMLAAFEALPERWQRVLWLSEVEEASRAEISAELGIRPNAVSALYRRARKGLRTQWLALQIPAALREDPAHVAHLLPTLILNPRGSLPREVNGHLAECHSCAQVDEELRGAARRMRKGNLALAGFAALGVALPAAHAPVTTATAIALIGTTTGIGTAVAAGISVMVAGLALTAGTLVGTTQHEDGLEASRETSTQSAEHTESTGTGQTSSSGSARTPLNSGRVAANESRPPAAGTGAAEQPSGTGRGNADAVVPNVDFQRGVAPGEPYIPPAAPAPATPGSIPEPQPAATLPLIAGLSTSASASYLGPALSGTTAPGASIAVELTFEADVARSLAAQTRQYTRPTDDTGAWVFDTRTVLNEVDRVYTYRVWAFTAEATSAVETGTFAVLPLQLQGFEGLSLPIDISEASTTGLTFRVTGPPNGSVCLVALNTGQAAEIPLDANGTAMRRIRFLTSGTYSLVFNACEGEYRGPSQYTFVDVSVPGEIGFGFWGGGSSVGLFELSDP